MRWSATALAEAVGGRLLRTSTKQIASAFIDSRTPVQEAIFVPIVAERDGHEFVTDAIRGGASAVLLASGHPMPAGDLTVVGVADTLVALSSLARDARNAISGPVVAVTGSNGKTSTRAMVQAVLETGFGRVLCTRGNLNNHLGVPLTLVGEPHEADAAVIEMGMSAPGEVDHLSGIVRPDIAVITSIALEHVESMGTLEAIAAAEFEVAAHLPVGGALVIPSDEPRLHALVSERLRSRCQIYTFGPDAGADVRVVDVQVGRSTVATLEVRGERYTARLRTFGAHNARNAAAAVCVALQLGLDVALAVQSLELVEPVGDRGRVLEWGEHLIIADCYNANPGSMEAAIRSLAMLRAHRTGPLVAVLGDMLELGPGGKELHAEVGSMVAAQGLDAVLGFGPLSANISQSASAGGVLGDHVLEDVAQAVDWVRGQLEGRPPGAVLFKASRGMRLERVIAALAG